MQTATLNLTVQNHTDHKKQISDPIEQATSLQSAAAPLLSIMVSLREMSHHAQVADLHQDLIHRMKRFNQQCKQLSIPREHRITARYLLCSGLDEAILNTAWGVKSGWAERPLLSIFHHETTGGEKVFLIIKQLLQAPEQNIALIELAFLLLKMGFEGKYRFNLKKRDRLANICESLNQALMQHYQERSSSLDLSSTNRNKMGADAQGKPLRPPIPLRLYAIAALMLLIVSFAGFQHRLTTIEKPLIEELEALQSFTPTLNEDK